MIKSELTVFIAERAGISKDQAQKAVQAFQDAIIDSIKADSSLDLLAFGKFVPKKFKARKNFNFKTGKTQDLPPTTSVQFKASPSLKRLLNE